MASSKRKTSAAARLKPGIHGHVEEADASRPALLDELRDVEEKFRAAAITCRSDVDLSIARILRATRVGDARLRQQLADLAGRFLSTNDSDIVPPDAEAACASILVARTRRTLAADIDEPLDRSASKLTVQALSLFDLAAIRSRYGSRAGVEWETASVARAMRRAWRSKGRNVPAIVRAGLRAIGFPSKWVNKVFERIS